MDAVGIFFIILAGVTVVAYVILAVRLWRRFGGWKSSLFPVAAFLLAYGGIGLVATQLAINGFLPDAEWPFRSAEGVQITPDHHSIVPLSFASRIQIYDKQGKFIRGWPVQASGGKFAIELDSSNDLEVMTARTRERYVYTMDGSLILKTNLASGETVPYDDGESIEHSVPLWLWTIANPIQGWVCFILGGIAFAIASGALKARGKSLNESPEHKAL
jgi:hypothetical protein